MTTQLITPNPDIACTPGMCLQYVRQAFWLPAHYASASEAWDNSTSQHPDQNFPADVWLPVWFSLEAIPAGHVALRAPDGSVYSSSDNSATPHHHPSLDDLMSYYAYYHLPLTYLGWTEDVAGTPVVSVDSSINFDSIPTSTPQESDMSAEEVKQIIDAEYAVGDNILKDLRAQIVAGTNAVEAHMDERATAIVTAIFNTPVPASTGGTTTLGAMIGWNDSHVNAIIDATKTAGAPLDTAAIQKAVSAALAGGVHVNITTT